MKKLQKYIILLLVMASIVTQIAKIYISNTTALDSIEASKIQAKIDAVSESNIELRSQVLAFSSYQNVASKAADLGYKHASEIVSVYDPLTVAVSR